MKVIFTSLFVVSFLLASIVCDAQKVDSPYEVATWFGFRDAAVSYTFDDGCANQFTKAIPLFDEFGYKLTLYTVVNWSSGNWTKLQSASMNGHEVASHTLSHLKMTGVPLEKQLLELQNSRLEIDKQITNAQCLTFAYPNCALGDYGIVGQNYISARGCQGFIEGKTPKDFLNVSSLMCGTQSSLKTAENLNGKINSAISSKGWLVFLFHGVDEDGGYSSFGSTEMRKNLEYVQKMDSQIWVATFLDATLYVRERDAVNVQELSANKKLITVSVTDTLDNTIYKYPVSISRTLPLGWSNAEVSQNEKPIACKLVGTGTSKKIQFNAVPDAGEVKIMKRGNKETSPLRKKKLKKQVN
ncbi:MAG TPA: polysaccharide deacetylase family protein [Prolixibacteraceae bacterium]|jgi:oligosaccharide reducing-end xylanase